MKLRIPKLNYKQKTIRNIAVMILLLGFVWMNVDCPLPTAEMEFRRLERRMLLEETGEIIRLRIGGQEYLGAMGTEQFHLMNLEDRQMQSCQVPEQGRLIPLFTQRWFEGEYALLALGVPGTITRAELELELSAWSYESIRDDELEYRVVLELPHDDPGMMGLYRHHQWEYVVEGETLTEGVVLFRITPQGDMHSPDAEAEDVAEEHALFGLGQESTYTRAQEGRKGHMDFAARALFYRGDEIKKELSLTPRESSVFWR